MLNKEKQNYEAAKADINPTADDSIDACDAPLLELQIQIASIWNDNKQFRSDIKHLKTILRRTLGCVDCSHPDLRKDIEKATAEGKIL